MKPVTTSLLSTLDNPYVENIVRQLLHPYQIIQLFFSGQEASTASHLVIHLKQKAHADQLRSCKWVKKVGVLYHINVYFIYSARLHHQFSLGNPFIARYCHASALIYQNEEYGDGLAIGTDWPKYKKKFHVFEERFYNDHDLQLAHIQLLIKEGSCNSVFTTYERLLEYNVGYLENLYSGNSADLLPLNERICNLARYVPEIQQCFVGKNRKTYYLTELFAQAKKAAAEGEMVYNSEMYGAVARTEQRIFAMIEQRLARLKKLVKKGIGEKEVIERPSDSTPRDEIIDIAIATLSKLLETEQIYVYHQLTYGQKKTYYLLIIARGLGNEKLTSITQSLKSKTGGNFDFSLISHDRYWIQKNLYRHQHFFAPIIQHKHLAYSSGAYHAELHWEAPHQPYHADLYFYYRAAGNTALQFFSILDSGKDNYQGLEYLFTLFFVSFCRTYIYVKTYYIPNYLSNLALWQLCHYADPDIRKYDYLLEQFPADFFSYLDKHMALQHRLSKLKEEEVAYMRVIVERLANELHSLVVEGGLLATFERIEQMNESG